MKKVYVRWLGWHSSVTSGTFKFEMSRGTESCAEVVTNNHPNLPEHTDKVWVGLLVNKAAVVREFPNDAWSELDGTHLVRGKGGIRAGYKTKEFTHTEAWIAPGGFTGIVLYETGFSNLKAKYQAIVREVSKKYGLPVYTFYPGKPLRKEAIS